eukprot:TRINITY_DN22055_c0_g1_i2.p1 TRINITY_DN22055_c0_g1~~TRINITY_DN22055_c0_g1_i2.p1  ORF type:complete len:212 (+),score=35.33 TRINITY_DN22055_c0_g1_i2:62-697(+)
MPMGSVVKGLLLATFVGYAKATEDPYTACRKAKCPGSQEWYLENLEAFTSPLMSTDVSYVMNKLQATGGNEHMVCACEKCKTSLVGTGWPVAEEMCANLYQVCLQDKCPLAMSWGTANQAVVTHVKWNEDADWVVEQLEAGDGVKPMQCACSSCKDELRSVWAITNSVCKKIEAKGVVQSSGMRSQFSVLSLGLIFFLVALGHFGHAQVVY